MLPNPYAEGIDPNQLFSPEQRAQFMQHQLTTYPTWLAVVLHFLTLGIFSVVYQGLKFSKLPLVKSDDFTSGKGIGFMFIPYFNLYWLFRFWLGLCDRLNFQYKLRGEPPPISRGLVLTTCILSVIPYINILVGFLVFHPIVVAIMQSATNRLVEESPPAAGPYG